MQDPLIACHIKVARPHFLFSFHVSIQINQVNIFFCAILNRPLKSQSCLEMGRQLASGQHMLDPSLMLHIVAFHIIKMKIHNIPKKIFVSLLWYQLLRSKNWKALLSASLIPFATKPNFKKKLGPGASLNFLYACFDTNAQIQLLYSVEDVEKKLDNNYIRPDAIGLDFTIDHWPKQSIETIMSFDQFPWPLKTIETNGQMTLKPLKNHDSMVRVQKHTQWWWWWISEMWLTGVGAREALNVTRI